MNDFRKLVKRIGNGRKYLFLLILRAPFDALRTWMLASLMKAVFLCLETQKADRLFTICVIFGLLCAVLFFYNGTIWSIYAAFSAKVEIRMQRGLLDKLFGLSLRKVESHLGGEWLTRINGDVQSAMMMMNGPMNMPHLVVAILNTMLSSVLMLGNSVPLFGVTMLFIIPHLWLNYKVVLKKIPQLKEEAQKALAENTASIKPLITEAEAIWIYEAEELLMRQCEESSDRLMRINRKIHMRNAMSKVLMRLFGLGGYLAVLLLGYSYVYRDTMTFSDVVYCFQIRGSIIGGIFMLIVCMSNIKANGVCVKRINDMFEE